MIDSSPLVSIIIPCYNVSAYVEKAVHSIIGQTYKNLEIWIIDDASTDDTLERVNRIKDDRIKVVLYKENTQKVGAVNEVLQKVTGSYIAFQDADDWSEPRRIGEQVSEFLKNSALGICFTGFDIVTEKKHLKPNSISLSNEELRDEFLNYAPRKTTGSAATICGTMMISRKVLELTKGYHPCFKGRVAEDVHWIYRILKNFEGITINKCLYYYRVREGSFTDEQAKGLKAKYAYSWHLLSKIIQKDVQERIDVLSPENKYLLEKLELEACEEALVENVRLVNHTRKVYEDSVSFRLGKFLLTPIRVLKSMRKR